MYEPFIPLSANVAVTEVSCFGFSDGILTVVPTGGTAPYSYLWNNGQNSQSLTGLSIGTYTCTVTDYNGCITFATATVGQPLQLNLTSSSIATSCFSYSDGSATVVPQGGTGSYTYNWSNGQTTQQAINLISGTYSVMVLDNNSCAASASFTVGQPVQVGAVLTTTNILCNGDSTGNITVNNVTGTTGPYIYFWSDGHDDPINQNLIAGTYYVTITDGNGCSNTFTQTLTDPLVISSTLSYSDMKIKVITSYKPGTWESFARRGIHSMAEQFPPEVDVFLYCEEQQPIDVDGRITCVDLIQAEPELFKFKDKHKDDPTANGKVKQIEGGVRRSPNLQGLDKNNDSFLWDAVRFANKVFCVINAVRNSNEYDYVLWIDADTFTFRPVPTDFFTGLLPKETMLTYLGRENPTLGDGGVYPECGFVGYNLKHPEIQNFINDWEQLYKAGDVFKILEWHDSYVFWHLSKIYRSIKRLY